MMKSIKFNVWDQRKELLEKIDLFRNFFRFEIPKVAGLYSHIVFFGKNEKIFVRAPLIIAFTYCSAVTSGYVKMMTLKPLRLLSPVIFLERFLL